MPGSAGSRVDPPGQSGFQNYAFFYADGEYDFFLYEKLNEKKKFIDFKEVSPTNKLISSQLLLNVLCPKKIY
jgi:hypothetical protein